MKKNLILTLSIAFAVMIVSCKKDPLGSKDEPKVFSTKLSTKMTLPGQGNLEAYLVQQPDGTYQAVWAGDTFIFANMPHKIIDVIDGEPIPYVEFASTFQYNIFSTNGAYFIVDRPQIGSSFNVNREQLVAFGTAYNNYVQQNVDEYGNLKQPNFPTFDTYVITTSNIIKGMIVSSNASPSKMSIVPANFIPTIGMAY